MASPMPEHDEVSDEDFRGPFGPGEAEGYDEAWDDAYEAEAAALFEEEPLASPGVGSDFTQLGAAPGTSNTEEEVSGYRVHEPVEEPPQVHSAEFVASSEEELRAEPSLTNPDGSPIVGEETLASELQRVQREIARRRRNRMLQEQML